MIRYLVMSAIIVVAAAVIIAGWVNRDLIRLKIASVYARVAPKPGARQPLVDGSSARLYGDAPWALSALPECLRQESESRGSASYVRAHLPAEATPIAPPEELKFGDCTIMIRGWEAFVHRGSDVFRIPPRVDFFRTHNGIALLRIAGGNAELRVYEPATP